MVNVTILILIDGFLQLGLIKFYRSKKFCHNPYFNRWFSAINSYITKKYSLDVTILILIDGFLQYINGHQIIAKKDSHNPYFNRWFSAI